MMNYMKLSKTTVKIKIKAIYNLLIFYHVYFVANLNCFANHVLLDVSLCLVFV